MKSITTLALVSFFAVVQAFSQEIPISTDITVTLQQFMPGDDEIYDSGFGFESQLRFWPQATVGWSLAFGMASWDLEDQADTVSENSLLIDISMEGSILVMPIGGSIFLRPTLEENAKVTIECGWRYVIVESDVQIDYAVANARGRILRGGEILEIGDGIIGLIALNGEIKLSPGFSLLAGIGYQFDVFKGNVIWMGEVLGDNELKAVFLSAGFAVTF